MGLISRLNLSTLKSTGAGTAPCRINVLRGGWMLSCASPPPSWGDEHFTPGEKSRFTPSTRASAWSQELI